MKDMDFETLRNQLKKNGFSLIRKGKSEEFFGNYYFFFRKDDIEILFDSDRSIEDIKVRNVSHDGTWYDIPLIIALLENRTILNKAVDINEMRLSLYENLTKICLMFSGSNYL